MQQAPIRNRLLAAHGITGFGDGLWFTVWAIYLTAVQGMLTVEMGVGLGAGSAIGLAVAAPLGAIADRWKPRDLLAVLTVVRAASLFSFLWMTSFWPLVAASALLVATQGAASGVRTMVIYKLVDAQRRLRVLAQSRVTQHIAYAVGAGSGALVLAVDTREAYAAAIIAITASLLAAGVITMAVPAVVAVPAERQHKLTQAVQDLPFLAVMLSTAPLTLCWAVLAPGIALWVRSDTAAPQWTSAFAVVMSSVAIAFFQVHFTKRVRRTVGAVRAARWSAFSLAACCMLFLASAWPESPLLAFGIVTAGVAVHALGELQFVAARWGLSLRLMARDAEGQYQGVVAITEAAVSAVGPAVVTVLLASVDGYGWVAIAALIVLPVIPLTFLVRTALRTRPGRPIVYTAPGPTNGIRLSRNRA